MLLYWKRLLPRHLLLLAMFVILSHRIGSHRIAIQRSGAQNRPYAIYLTFRMTNVIHATNCCWCCHCCCCLLLLSLFVPFESSWMTFLSLCCCCRCRCSCRFLGCRVGNSDTCCAKITRMYISTTCNSIYDIK